MEVEKNHKITFLLVAINLLILALYQLNASSAMYKEILSAMYIVAHCVILAILTIIFFAAKKSYIGQGLGISIAVVLLVGYGTCAMM